MNYQTQKILLTGNIDDEAHAYLLWCCEQSNKLYNSVLFSIRQDYFENCNYKTWFDKNDNYRRSPRLRRIKVSYAQLCKDFKDNVHYQAIGGQQGQQTIKSVVEAIKGYNKLLPMWFNGELKDKPKIPNYRKKGLYQVSFTSQNIRYEPLEGICYLPIANSQRKELETPSIIIPSGVNFQFLDIAEIRIIPQTNKLWAEYIYKTQSVKGSNLDYSQGLGIDHGVTNWLSCTTTKGKSFIVNGRKIKSINQRYNRFIAKHKQGQHQDYWDDQLEQATHKRNCQMRDAVNKAARFIINYCLKHQIGNIVFGWNDGQKNSINIGKTNNQNFAQIPTARLKNPIQQLAESVGIIFTEIDEAYSSKASFLDNDLVPNYGEKPQGYKFSGKRIKRGLYQTAKGWLVNSDTHAAANCLRKVATQLGLDLARVGKECLTVPKRYDLENLTKSYRKQAEMWLQPIESLTA
ncbi:RNA-guided endonuclease TnpB family protein [Cyanothece sp. BG0011]|uniref:RNA-guided endonuclease InsQ/TnpB family protein n=1 Tax=Cyanothece sp. BG0011 TaxID=2082950 RepID=UPI000D1FB184|nr:RNA-guided endonuclease TnpB family protein [Cyanothece sp. BG0011]